MNKRILLLTLLASVGLLVSGVSNAQLNLKQFGIGGGDSGGCRRNGFVGRRIAAVADLRGREPAGAERPIESCIGDGHEQCCRAGAAGGGIAERRNAVGESVDADGQHAAVVIADVDPGIREPREWRRVGNAGEQAGVHGWIVVVGQRREPVFEFAVGAGQYRPDESIVAVAGGDESTDGAERVIYRAIGARAIAVVDVNAELGGAVRVEPWDQCAVDRDVGVEGRAVVSVF